MSDSGHIDHQKTRIALVQGQQQQRNPFYFAADSLLLSSSQRFSTTIIATNSPSECVSAMVSEHIPLKVQQVTLKHLSQSLSTTSPSTRNRAPFSTLNLNSKTSATDLVQASSQSRSAVGQHPNSTPSVHRMDVKQHQHNHQWKGSYETGDNPASNWIRMGSQQCENLVDRRYNAIKLDSHISNNHRIMCELSSSFSAHRSLPISDRANSNANASSLESMDPMNRFRTRTEHGLHRSKSSARNPRSRSKRNGFAHRKVQSFTDADPSGSSSSLSSALPLSMSSWNHPCYNIYQRNASPALQQVYDCIYGLPFRGSVAFVGSYIDGKIKISNTSCMRRFQGVAETTVDFEADENLPKLQAAAISGGYDDGNVAQLLVNGVDYSLNRRGFNMVVVQRNSLRVQLMTFDTHSASGDDGERMQQFLAQTLCSSTECVLLIALRDDACTCLTRASHKALRLAGVDIPDPDDYQRMQPFLAMLPPHKTSILLNVVAKANTPRCARALIEAGWDVNARSKHDYQNTPLHDAVFRGNKEVVAVFVEMGARSDICNREGRTAVDMAREMHGYASLVEMVGTIQPNGEDNDLVESVLRHLDLDM